MTAIMMIQAGHYISITPLAGLVRLLGELGFAITERIPLNLSHKIYYGNVEVRGLTPFHSTCPSMLAVLKPPQAALSSLRSAQCSSLLRAAANPVTGIQ